MLEKKEITEEEYNTLRQEREELFYKQQEDLLAGFVGGFKGKYEYLQELTTGMTTALQEQFQNVFLSIFNMLEQGGLTARKVFDSISKAFIQMLAKMWAEYLAKKVMFTLLGAPIGLPAGGGLLGIIPGLQTGGVVKETGIAKVEKGEVILNPEQQRKLFKTVNINLNINGGFLDRKGQEEFIRQIIPVLKRELSR